MRALHYEDGYQLLCSIVKGLPLPFKFTCKSCAISSTNTIQGCVLERRRKVIHITFSCAAS
ncbi:anaphase-promoting complex subunit 5 isoform X1 [Iris pallida]|uniref:Anaphase-promoting complex subunit 5 isoform X1 n=1 Tax=Iris pallida TaxID=29817 RepID=A0AAX6E0V3_IRIPA|nr:anaphase-promoting complex subunit 5 isoform X1 [Iris pallida]